MKKVAQVVMGVVALSALATALGCIMYLVYDVNWKLELDKAAQSDIMFIVGLGFIAYGIATISGPVLDKILDKRYPDDKPPSESYWKNR